MTATEHHVVYLALSADDEVIYWNEQAQSELNRENMTGSPIIHPLFEQVSLRGYTFRIHDQFVTTWNTKLCECEDLQLGSISGNEAVQTVALSLATEQTVKINGAIATCARHFAPSYIETLIRLVPRLCLIGCVSSVDKMNIECQDCVTTADDLNQNGLVQDCNERPILR